MSPKRRLQSFGLLIITLLNSFAELVSISAIIPVLTLLVNEDGISNSKALIFFSENLFPINEGINLLF